MKRPTLRLPSPAMAVAISALILALAGTAYAAGEIVTSDLKKEAVTTNKLKKEAITAAKLKNGAVTNGKIADGAVTAAKLAPGTIPPPTPPTPPTVVEGYATNLAVNDQIAIAAGSETTVATLNLPPGRYILSASVNVSGKAIVNGEQVIFCALSDDGAAIARGATVSFGEAKFMGSVSVDAVSDGGGAITYSCESEKGSQARSRTITAVKVGSLVR